MVSVFVYAFKSTTCVCVCVIRCVCLRPRCSASIQGEQRKGREKSARGTSRYLYPSQQDAAIAWTHERRQIQDQPDSSPPSTAANSRASFSALVFARTAASGAHSHVHAVAHLGAAASAGSGQRGSGCSALAVKGRVRRVRRPWGGLTGVHSWNRSSLSHDTCTGVRHFVTCGHIHSLLGINLIDISIGLARRVKITHAL